MIHFSDYDKIVQEKCINDQRKAIETLRSGRINYTTRSLIPNDPKNNGSAYIEISEIESIVFESYVIKISLKSNKVICLNSTDYEYLKYLYA